MQSSLVVFDLDGTLIDSAPDLHGAVNHMLAEFGCAPLSLSEVRSMVGDGEVDAATTHAAGVPFVLMIYGYHRGPIGDIASFAALDHFHELTDLVGA